MRVQTGLRPQTIRAEPKGRRPADAGDRERALSVRSGGEGRCRAPRAERRAIHGESKQDEQGSDYENELSHGLPPKAPWPACVPNPAAPRGHRLVLIQSSSGAIFPSMVWMGHRLKLFPGFCALPACNPRESLQRLILGASVAEPINVQAPGAPCA